MKSFWTITTIAIALSSLAGYTYVAARGVEYGAPSPEFVPDEVRTKPGGYRSFHFWHVGFGGYRGGK